jgi:ribosomal protein L16 Arg81 hydroxylase
MTIDQVLEPMGREEFIARFLGERMWVVQDRPQRFRALVPWDQLNALLSRSRFQGMRCRVVKNAKQLDPSAFLFSPGNELGSYIHARKLENLLRDGATLVLNNVDEWFDEVRGVAESCEEMLRIPVGVNLYAGWRKDNGFDLHWDDHDTLILQVSGRKRWTVYEPTELHPVPSMRESMAAPTGAPAWEGVLEEGDLLYMPRGWWHVAFPMDEPTLHVTIGWPHKTGLDLLKAVVDRMSQQVEIRADLPHLQSVEARVAYAGRLRTLMLEALTDDVVERFMRRSERDIATRPLVGLPESATPGIPNVDKDSPIRLVAEHRLHIPVTPGQRDVSFNIGESAWSCDAALVPAFQLLRSARSTTMEEMVGVVPPEQATALEGLVVMMVARGALWVERRASRGA